MLSRAKNVKQKGVAVVAVVVLNWRKPVSLVCRPRPTAGHIIGHWAARIRRDYWDTHNTGLFSSRCLRVGSLESADARRLNTMIIDYPAIAFITPSLVFCTRSQLLLVLKSRASAEGREGSRLLAAAGVIYPGTWLADAVTQATA